MLQSIWSVYQVWCTPPGGAPILVCQVYSVREAEALLARVYEELGNAVTTLSIRRVRGVNPCTVRDMTLLTMLVTTFIDSTVIRISILTIAGAVLLWSIHELRKRLVFPNEGTSSIND